MEPRRVTRHKENVPPGPATPRRPEQRRFLRRLGAGLGRGHGQSVPICQVTSGGPAAIPSPGAALPQEPCRVQTNLASPHPRLGLALKDTAGRLVTSGFQQQSNLWSPAQRPQGKAQESAVQQENLCLGGATSTPLWESHRPPAHLPLCTRQVPLAAAPPCPNLRPATGFASPDGHPRLGPRAWCPRGCRPARRVGEPLTLEDLAVPARSQAWDPPHTATRLLLASVKRLEQEAALLRGRMSPEPPDCVWWGSHASSGQASPARPQPSQPAPASWEERRYPQGLVETWGVQAGLSDPGTHSKPESFQTALGVFTGNFLDSEQGVLPVQPPQPTYGREARGMPSLPQGTGSMEARLVSAAFSSTAGDVLPGQEGGKRALREQASREERMVSCLPEVTPTRRPTRQSKARKVMCPEPQAARWQLLSRCFRAWRRLVWRRWAVAVAVALSRRRLLLRGLRALRWSLWLREARLEAAWGRHTKALLARSFREWRCLALQQAQGPPHVQPASRPPCHSPSLERAVVDPAQKSSSSLSPGRLGQEEPAWPSPLQPGQRADGGNGWGQLLQAAQQRAVFLLQWHQEDRTRQGREVQQDAPQTPPRTQRMASPPQAWPRVVGASEAPQLQRAWLHRCFGAWRQLARRGAQCQSPPADPRVGTRRMCPELWVQMRQLRASEGTPGARLSPCLKEKAGEVALHSSIPGATRAHGLETVAQEPGQGSLPEARRGLTLPRVLRLCQHQQATPCSQGQRERTLRCILSWWRWRACGPDTLCGRSKTTSALEPQGGEAWRGCSGPPGPLEQAPRAPVLLEPLRVSFLGAAERQRQRQSLLVWAARARQSQSAARWCRCSLQRRVLLGWSRWTTAQGARRQSAARWAWDRSCRAALGLWRQRLAQRQVAEQRARERQRGLARKALCCWRSCWQRRQFLHEQLQRCLQGRLQGLRRAALQGWRQAAAGRRRHKQRILRSWAQSVAQGHVQQAAITQLQQAGLRRLLWTHWAQWQTALLRVRLESRTQAQGTDLERWSRLASRGRLVLMDTSAPWKQTHSCWTPAPEPELPQQTWEHSHRAEGTWKEAWAQSDREHPLCPTFWFWLPWPGQGSWASSWLPSGRRVGGLGSPDTSALQGQGEAPWRRLGIPEAQSQAHGSALLHGHDGVRTLLVLRRKYLQRWRLGAQLHRLQASQNARRLAVTWRRWADAHGVQQLSQTLLRQWHLGQAWRMWRRRVVQLRVAGRLRQQEERWVLSQAFEQWRQCLAARSQRRGAASSLRPWSGQRLPSPWGGGLGPERGSSCSGDAVPPKAQQSRALPSHTSRQGRADGPRSPAGQ